MALKWNVAISLQKHNRDEYYLKNHDAMIMSNKSFRSPDRMLVASFICSKDITTLSLSDVTRLNQYEMK